MSTPSFAGICRLVAAFVVAAFPVGQAWPAGLGDNVAALELDASGHALSGHRAESSRVWPAEISDVPAPLASRPSRIKFAIARFRTMCLDLNSRACRADSRLALAKDSNGSTARLPIEMTPAVVRSWHFRRKLGRRQGAANAGRVSTCDCGLESRRTAADVGGATRVRTSDRGPCEVQVANQANTAKVLSKTATLVNSSASPSADERSHTMYRVFPTRMT